MKLDFKITQRDLVCSFELSHLRTCDKDRVNQSRALEKLLKEITQVKELI